MLRCDREKTGMSGQGKEGGWGEKEGRRIDGDKMCGREGDKEEC